jgi:hypothetical protein
MLRKGKACPEHGQGNVQTDKDITYPYCPIVPSGNKGYGGVPL